MALDLDRFATLYLVSPLRKLEAGKQNCIPILMYHSIAYENESGVSGYYRVATTPEKFRAQMEFLARNGYQAITLSEARRLFNASEPIGKKVVITFDDGYLNFYTGAFPALQEFGLTATMYLPTSFIGEDVVQFKGRECLSWSHVRELQKFGIVFGSHTVTHPQLRDLDRSGIERELIDSKKTIDDKTGIETESFAYPYAFPQADTEFRKVVRESLEKAQYRDGVCTIVGRAGQASDRYFLERLPVNNLDDEAFLRAKLDGAYDWVGSLQYVVKKRHAVRRRLFH
jgi:peptidoglycan/xylan/chitin deacetylase (PgdA/CDA1 family)